MPNRDAWTELRPTGRGHWHRSRVVTGCVALAVFAVAVLLFLRDRHHEHFEKNWQCATALVEDVRPKVIGQVSNAKGVGAMLYEVSILAKYVSDGVEQERWITVEQPPVSFAEAELQTSRWKGQHCVVRWKVARPEDLVVEVE